MVGIVHGTSADNTTSARLKLLTGAVAASLLILVLMFGTAPAAHADTTPTPAPSPSGGLGSTPPAAHDSAPVTIESPSSDAFIASGSATVSGTKAADDEIQLFAEPSNGTPLCVAGGENTGRYWSCAGISLPNGPSVKLDVVVTGDATRSASTTVSVLGPPTVSTTNGAVLSNGLVHGTAYPGARVSAQVSGGAQCTFTADSSGQWACVLSRGMPDGRYTISASQTGPWLPNITSDSSDALAFQLDTVAPSAPAITAPASGTHLGPGVTTTYSGSGEDGASVTVWAASDGGSTRLCAATVSGGTWSCVGGALPAGSYSVSALQQDAAGNSSPASTTVSLRYATPPVPAPSSSPSDGATPPGNTATPSAPASPSAPGTGSPAPTAPSGPGGSTPGGDLAPSLTPLTAAVQPVAQLGELGDWVRAGIFALIALALLAVPARLLAGTLATARADSGARAWKLFGRNHAAAEFDEAPDVHAAAPWIVPAAGLLATTAIVALASPVSSQFAYLRMSLAVLAALLIVAVVSIAAPIAAARRFPGVTTATAFAPYMLLLVAAASVISRILQLQPTLLFGVIIVVTVTSGARAARGKIAAIHIGALTVLAAVGWLVIGVLPSPSTALAAFTAEFVNAVVLIAIGSAAVLMLPLGSLPGRAILQWSRGVWLGVAVAVDTVLFAILVPIGRLNSSGAGTILFAVFTIGFAAVSVSVWLWQKYIAPALR